MAYIGSTPVPQGIKETQSFTATAGQTTFNTLGYSNGNNISVFLNGVRLINGTDYTATNGSDIVLTAAASATDVLDFETFNEFNLVNQNLTTPTFTDTVVVSGDTTASLTLKNNTHEDTDGGRESTFIFKGEQSGGEISTLAEIEASHDGTADDQKGSLSFKTNDGSDGAAPTERLKIDSTGKSTFKDDVGIEGETPTLQMYDTNVTNNVMDASYDEYLTLDIDPNNVRGNSGLIVKTDNSEKIRLHNSGTLQIGSDTNAGYGPLQIGSTSTASSVLQMLSATNGYATIHFGDATSGTDRYEGYIQYDHNHDRLNISAASSNKVSIDNDGLKFNGDTSSDNALNDYEQGTWTPTAAQGATGVNVDAPNCIYTKVGNMVMLQFEISNLTSPNGNTFNLGGLPFTSIQESIGAPFYQNVDIPGTRYQLSIYAGTNVNYLRIYAFGDNSGWSSITGNNLGTTFNMMGTIVYRTS
jgi:hypothetical protein